MESQMLGRRAIGGIVAGTALLVLVGCSGGSAQPGRSATPISSAPAATSASPASTPRTEVEASCSVNAPADVRVADLTMKSANGVTLAAATLGTGRRGVVMLDQSDDDMCGWPPYAGFLAQHGYHVLLFDRRCTSGSSCPDGEAANNHAVNRWLISRGKGHAVVHQFH
jgi:hypothetical protein